MSNSLSNTKSLQKVFLYEDFDAPLAGVSIPLEDLIAGEIRYQICFFNKYTKKAFFVYGGRLHESVFEQLEILEEKNFLKALDLNFGREFFNIAKEFFSGAIGEKKEGEGKVFFENLYYKPLDCGAKALASLEGKVEFFDFSKKLKDEETGWFFHPYLELPLQGIQFPVKVTLVFFEINKDKFIFINTTKKNFIRVPRVEENRKVLKKKKNIYPLHADIHLEELEELPSANLVSRGTWREVKGGIEFIPQ